MYLSLLRVLPRERAEFVLVERLTPVVADRHDLRRLPASLTRDESEDDLECVVAVVALANEVVPWSGELRVLEAGNPAAEVNAVPGRARLRHTGVDLAIEHVQRDLTALAGQNENTLRLERLESEDGAFGHGNDLFRLSNTANNTILQ